MKHGILSRWVVRRSSYDTVQLALRACMATQFTARAEPHRMNNVRGIYGPRRPREGA